MESKGHRNSDDGKLNPVGDSIEYREAVRKQLNDEIKKVIELEMQKAAKELLDEHKKATRQVVEEYRTAIGQIVEEEKQEIWRKAETLKQSLLQLSR